MKQLTRITVDKNDYILEYYDGNYFQRIGDILLICTTITEMKNEIKKIKTL